MFAVFGVTDTFCATKAQKLVESGKYYRSKELDEDGDPICYHDKEQIAEAMFNEIAPTKLSTIYSNRSEAEAYRKLAERSVKHRALQIRKRVHPLDKNGDPVIDEKTKKPKYSWEAA